ncbi:MAG: hypothetical protein JWM18_1131 [Chloroflexi bacterium]|nr:hypothetical protein [Chloroflexota bacterium]
MASGSGEHQPEQKTVLGFPLRPGGDGKAVQDARHYWYELAQEIHGAFSDLDRAISGIQWSGDGRKAFDARWSEFSGHGTEATQHSQEMGDHLFRLGNQIFDAQHEWDLAMGAMTASTAIGIGLTFVTFGVSDAVAEGAATAAVGTMEAICAALDVTLDAVVQVLAAAIRIAAQLAVKFSWQFGINVVSQEAANTVEGRGLGSVDLLQAAEFAGVSVVIPGVLGNVTVNGTRVLEGASGAILTGAVTDAGVQGVEGLTEGKPFSPAEVVVSGALAGAGHIAAEELGAHLRTQADDVSPTELAPSPPTDLTPAMGADREARLLAEARALKTNPQLAHIPDDELAAIRGYTTDEGAVADYRRINSALRSGDSAAITRLQPYIAKIQAGLEHLPDHRGTVYRGTTLRPEVIGRFVEAARSGHPIVEDAFTSTTSDPSVAFSGNTRFVIRSAHGKDVSPISVFGTEQEVLFPPGTKFRVLSVTESSAGDHVIMLREVP